MSRPLTPLARERLRRALEEMATSPEYHRGEHRCVDGRTYTTGDCCARMLIEKHGERR